MYCYRIQRQLNEYYNMTVTEKKQKTAHCIQSISQPHCINSKASQNVPFYFKQEKLQKHIQWSLLCQNLPWTITTHFFYAILQ